MRHHLDGAAAKLQSVWRGKQARADDKKAKAKGGLVHRSAAKVQSVWRGRQARSAAGKQG